MGIKKIVVCLILICWLFTNPCLTGLSQVLSSNISVKAEKISISNTSDEINKRILKKYFPVRLTINNTGTDPVNLPERIYFSIKDSQDIYSNNQSIIFDKTKVHTIRRVLTWGIPLSMLTFFILSPIIMSSIAAVSITSNQNLQDNLGKIIYRPKRIYPQDNYVSYIFIPNKYRNKIQDIILKNIKSINDVSFNIKVSVCEESL